MFRLYSKGCEYALRALVFMLASYDTSKFRAADVCKAADIPEAYTRKTFQALVQAGFLKAVTGPGGGYAFVTHPGKTSVLEIIRLVDGQETYEQCVLGMPFCSDKSACALHDSWVAVKDNLISELRSKTLNDLAEPLRKKIQNRNKRKTV